ncbi:heparan-alpha-glucosaminide N-acetyltransferase [uncultured Roseibium sp.]|uniref:DUF1624 domain-containing protein n=1 Tax=uncultured Roseibium sp. TaxID=1936171 RepID=UPI00321773C8
MARPLTMSRIPVIDALRGFAILAMIAYHLSWDLSWFGFVGWPVSDGPGWRIFSGAIAGSFLFLAGASLVLAHGQGIRWKAFWKREAVIVAAALAVSAGTYFTFSGIFVRFGILHSIAAGSLIALPFVRLPVLFAYAAAVVVYTMPHWASSPVFDGDLFLWTGLGTPASGSVDYVPLAPWAAAVLLGVAVFKTPGMPALLEAVRPLRLASWPGRLIRFCGRRSLAIYLVHQPVLYGLVWLVAAAGFAPDRIALGFQESCVERCVLAGGSEAQCKTICACTLTTLKEDGLWEPLLTNPEDPELLQDMNNHYNACTFPADSTQTPIR